MSIAVEHGRFLLPANSLGAQTIWITIHIVKQIFNETSPAGGNF
jgi:hypothetical protein